MLYRLPDFINAKVKAFDTCVKANATESGKKLPEMDAGLNHRYADPKNVFRFHDVHFFARQ